VRAHDESRGADVRAADETRVDYANGKLTVSATRRGFALFRGGAVDIDIALPSQSRVKASVASADVRAQGVFADSKIASASGDVDLDVVDGNLKAATASGSVTVKGVSGNASVTTASGGATIGELDGILAFKAASGDLGVARLSGALRAQTASGSVTVATAVRGGIQVSTAAVGLGHRFGRGHQPAGVCRRTGRGRRHPVDSGADRFRGHRHPPVGRNAGLTT